MYYIIVFFEIYVDRNSNVYYIHRCIVETLLIQLAGVLIILLLKKKRIISVVFKFRNPIIPMQYVLANDVDLCNYVSD